MDFIDSFLNIWHQAPVDVAWWKTLLMGLFIYICDVALCAVIWYCQMGAMIEYGYPKVKAKALKKQMKGHSVISYALLWCFVRNAKRRGFFLYLCFAVNLLNCAALLACTVGYIGMLLTSAKGCFVALSLSPAIGMFLFQAAVHFPLDFIFLPSERHRYK